MVKQESHVPQIPPVSPTSRLAVGHHCFNSQDVASQGSVAQVSQASWESLGLSSAPRSSDGKSNGWFFMEENIRNILALELGRHTFLGKYRKSSQVFLSAVSNCLYRRNNVDLFWCRCHYRTMDTDFTCVTDARLVGTMPMRLHW